MSLMLEALKQIERRKTPRTPGRAPVRLESPLPPVRDEAAIDATLAETELALDLAAGSLPWDCLPARDEFLCVADPVVPDVLEAFVPAFEEPVFDVVETPVPEPVEPSPSEPGHVGPEASGATRPGSDTEAATRQESETDAIAPPRAELQPASEPSRRAADIPKTPQPYADLAVTILSQLSVGRPATLVFTSPGDGEGTTTMLVTLARALAERITGGVLAVDANLGAPDLAGRFGVRMARGMADVLRDGTPWSEVVRKTSTPNLSVLPGGRLPAFGAPPAWNRLPGILAELRNHYRLVLVDAGSLVHDQVLPLAVASDGAYLVVRMQQTRRRMLQEAAQVLQRGGSRLMGCVVVK